LYLGSDSEVSLCDTEKILYIKNAFSDDRTQGAPIGEMQKSFVDNPQFHNVPSTVNYRALTKSGEKLRSATMFLHEGGELVGLLTINTRVDDLILCRKLIDRIIQGDQSPETVEPAKSKKKKSKDYYETLSLSITDLIDETIKRAVAKFNAPATRFNAEEKQAIVRELDDRGVFLVKGSVSELSKKLNTSEATIYRYLHQLQR
jgi:predicted transcriptional regulator YheO